MMKVAQYLKYPLCRCCWHAPGNRQRIHRRAKIICDEVLCCRVLTLESLCEFLFACMSSTMLSRCTVRYDRYYCNVSIRGSSWLSKVWENAGVFKFLDEKLLKTKGITRWHWREGTLIFKIETQSANMPWEDNFLILICHGGIWFLC